YCQNVAVVCRQKQNAPFIAGGIGRMTGKAGVAIATSGPGVSNLVGSGPRIPSIAAGQAPAAVRSYHLLSAPRWSFTNCSKEIAGRPSSRGTASLTVAAAPEAK